jgi:putative spermidine/putrescine transport system substrate-binding protein
MTLGDYWLGAAIRQQLIRPFDAADIDGWSSLPTQWQQLVIRDREGFVQPDGGLIWGAPYRWSTTVMAYRADRFEELGWLPQDWSDLWRPELQGHIALLDQPREVIGLTLKKLGYSYNESDLRAIDSLPSELAALHQQVKVYSSSAYIEPLLIGDVWLALGWSTDILPVMQRSREIAAIVPQSGTAFSADVWVQPQETDAAELDERIRQWIEFYWDPQVAVQLSLLSQGASPIVAGLEPTELPASLLENEVLLPTPEVRDRSEFLLPLTDDTAKAQWDLWLEMRQVG